MEPRRRRHRGKSSQKAERLFLRYGLYFFGGLALLVGGIWGGRTAFLAVQKHRLMAQARASFAKGDSRWASIAARRVYELDPKNVEALRMFAELAEQGNLAAAVDWRKEVVRVVPDSVGDLIALAQTALHFSQPSVVEDALNHAGDRAANLPAFHQAKAELAMAKNDHPRALGKFTEALRLEPQNKSYQLNLALCQLRSSAPEEHRTAQATLRALLDDPKQRLSAARALREDAVVRRDPAAVLETSRLVRGLPEAEFRDQLFYMQVLHQLGDSAFASELTACEEAAATQPLKLFELLEAMSREGLALVALDWIKHLPAEKLITPPVPLGVVHSFILMRDWPALLVWCRHGEWGPLEPLRHAAQARALREQDQSLDAREEWALALKSAGSDMTKLNALEKEVALWGWKTEATDLLWTLSKDPAQQDAALAALYKFYGESGETAETYRVAARLLELHPTDRVTQNNYAQLALLLNIDLPRAEELAAKLHREQPSDAVTASTYAYALFIQGKPSEAAQLLGGLDPAQLQQPQIAAYYGLFLAAAGQRDRAAEFLTKGEGASLLPEERTAIEKARASVGL